MTVLPCPDILETVDFPDRGVSQGGLALFDQVLPKSAVPGLRISLWKVHNGFYGFSFFAIGFIAHGVPAIVRMAFHLRLPDHILQPSGKDGTTTEKVPDM